MLKNYDELSPVAIDCLREIGNIGSGSAASSLSEMLGKPIEMKVPNVCVLEYQHIIDTMGVRRRSSLVYLCGCRAILRA